MQAARNQVLTAISYNAEKRVIGLKNSTFGIGNEDPDDVGVDQTPDLCLTLLEVGVQTGVLKRDCRLRCQHFEDRDSIRGKGVRGQRVLKVEQSRQPPLFAQR